MSSHCLLTHCDSPHDSAHEKTKVCDSEIWMSTPVSCSACQRNILSSVITATLSVDFPSSSMCIRTLCQVHVEVCSSYDQRSFFFAFCCNGHFLFDAAHLKTHAPRQSQDHVLCEMMRAIRTCGEAWHGDMRSRFPEGLHEYFVCT